MVDSCEVRDFVLVGAVEPAMVRMVNEAANDELRRRGEPVVYPSGELTGDAVAWVYTCTGAALVVPGTL